MIGIWKNKLFKLSMATVLAFFLMIHCSFSICFGLNNEGVALLKFRERVESDPFGVLSRWGSLDVAATDHCSWFGVDCLDGRVIVLSLNDLCLKGTLAPELGELTYIKSITLRNNSFQGNIPKEIVELEELEVLDLGYNNFSGPIPSDLGNNLSLSIFLVDSNKFLDGLTPEQHELASRSTALLDGNQLQLGSVSCETSCNSTSSALANTQDKNIPKRSLLQVSNENEDQNKEADKFPVITISPIPSPSPGPSFSFPPSISIPPSSPISPPSPDASASAPPVNPDFVWQSSPGSTPTLTVPNSFKSKHSPIILWVLLGSGSVFLFLCILAIFLFRSIKVVTIKPWSSGRSGQPQKGFVIGVPMFQRTELVTACEDFSNVIGSVSDGTVYKGTLSSGVEIAVTTTAVKHAQLWSKASDTQFRNKVEVLSSMNHKNFVNLIGYCEEEDPFTRMMVFEYAPNGTLFEHLYIKDSEHLDWATRIRIAVGMAYCLDHMHELSPPLALNNLHSSSVFLAEDYAAKISDFTFWNEMTVTKMGSPTTEFLETNRTDPQSNVYSFGIILFELITGKLPYSVNNELDDNWAADYLKLLPALKEMIDPTLRFVPEEEFEKLVQVIKICVNSDPKRRPTMKEVTAKLKEITDMGPDGATPKLSPLWWAELEILSSEGS